MGVSVSGGGRVLVGGTGVGVNVLDGICVGVGGMCVGVGLAAGGRPGLRVLVGGIDVRVGDTNTVDVLELFGTGENDGVGVAVGVNTYCEMTLAVNAAIVFKFEKAESTTFCGAMATGCASSAPANAMAETMQNKLNPKVPIAITVSGPEYFLNLTLVTLPNKLSSCNRDCLTRLKTILTS
jgi:hypothetical protein